MACACNAKDKTGPGACPFNLFRQDFPDRSRPRFNLDPSMPGMCRIWGRMAPAHRDATLAKVAALRVHPVPGDGI